MKWIFCLKDINELEIQEKNPRRITKSEASHLNKSITQFGLVQPIVITTDGLIIGGHQRVQVLKDKGVKMVECMQAEEEMTSTAIDELTIRLNKNTGSFDFDLLANSYEPELLLEWGFTMEDLHLESIPDQEEKPKVCQITAKFENEDDLRQAEIDIAPIIDKYASASFKVKIK